MNAPSFSRRLLLLLAALLVAPLAMAQDQTRTFSVSNFERLDIGSAMIINVSQGSGYNVTVTGRSEDLDDLEAVSSGGTLRVRYKDKNGWRKNRERVTVTITMPTLRGASFSGASKATVRGFRNQNALDLDVSGASTATIEVDAERVGIDFSGASTVTLTGKAKRLEGEISGATTLRGYDLSVEQAQLEASGASRAMVNVSGRLAANASGASSISYKGSTSSIQANTSGASSVRREN